MSEMEIFEFDGHQVRVVLIEGEPWWVVKDICDALGIRNARDAVTSLDRDDVGSTDVIDRLGRRQKNVHVVNEFGLNDLILNSRKPNARRLKRWLTHEVMPMIKRTGSYSLPGRALSLDGATGDLPAVTSVSASEYLLAVDHLRAVAQRVVDVEQLNIELQSKADVLDAWVSTDGGLLYFKQVAEVLAIEGLISPKDSENQLRWLLAPHTSETPAGIRGMNRIFKMRGLWWARPDERRARRFAYRYHTIATPVGDKQKHTLLFTKKGATDLLAELMQKRDQPFGNVRAIESGEPLSQIELIERLS